MTKYSFIIIISIIIIILLRKRCFITSKNRLKYCYNRCTKLAFLCFINVTVLHKYAMVTNMLIVFARAAPLAIFLHKTYLLLVTAWMKHWIIFLIYSHFISVDTTDLDQWVDTNYMFCFICEHRPHCLK